MSESSGWWADQDPTAPVPMVTARMPSVVGTSGMSSLSDTSQLEVVLAPRTCRKDHWSRTDLVALFSLGVMVGVVLMVFLMMWVVIPNG